MQHITCGQFLIAPCNSQIIIKKKRETILTNFFFKQQRTMSAKTCCLVLLFHFVHRQTQHVAIHLVNNKKNNIWLTKCWLGHCLAWHSHCSFCYLCSGFASGSIRCSSKFWCFNCRVLFWFAVLCTHKRHMRAQEHFIVDCCILYIDATKQNSYRILCLLYLGMSDAIFFKNVLLCS